MKTKGNDNIRVNISLPQEFYAAICRKAEEQYLKPNTIIKQLLMKSVNDMQQKGQPTDKKFY